MAFQPEVNQELRIDGVTYRVAPHPAAPSFPYGQEGRAAVVYQLTSSAGHQALKVFRPRFRSPTLLDSAVRLAPLAGLPGLAVCRRTVVTPERHSDLLRQHPDLLYAVLMPWIAGPTWQETMVERQPLLTEQSRRLARGLAGALAGMEHRGLAHGDLSAANLLLPALAPDPSGKSTPVELVDVEQLYSPEFPRPDPLHAGSAGYAHRSAPVELWGPHGDRFAGAVLLAEILGWCDARVREAVWGESYFEPAQVQQPGPAAATLVAALEAHWGAPVARLFEQAWNSASLAECPPFAGWLAALDPPTEKPLSIVSPAHPPVTSIRTPSTVPDQATAVSAAHLLGDIGRRLETQENFAAALAVYREAQPLVPGETELGRELAGRIGALESTPQPPFLPGRPAVVPLSPEPTPLGGGAATSPSGAAAPGVPGPGASPGAPPTSSRPIQDDFDDGLEALRHGDAAAAAQFLAEVVRRQPAYVREGIAAADLLKQARPAQMMTPAGSMRSLLILWFVGVTLGWGGGLALFWFAGHGVPYTLTAVAAGSIAGGSQWLVLRRAFAVSAWWVAATALGWLLGAVGAFDILRGPLGWATLGLFIGVGCGILQWLLYRQQGLDVRWWAALIAVASAVAGWLAFEPSGFGSFSYYGSSGDYSSAPSAYWLAGAGLVFAGITAGGLRLLKRP